MFGRVVDYGLWAMSMGVLSIQLSCQIQVFLFGWRAAMLHNYVFAFAKPVLLIRHSTAEREREIERKMGHRVKWKRVTTTREVYLFRLEMAVKCAFCAVLFQRCNSHPKTERAKVEESSLSILFFSAKVKIMREHKRGKFALIKRKWHSLKEAKFTFERAGLFSIHIFFPIFF